MILATPMRGVRPLLAALLLLVASALVVGPAHAASHEIAPQASAADFKVTVDVTVRDDDTFHMSMELIDNSETGYLTETTCNNFLSSSTSDDPIVKDADATFTEEDGKRTCVIEASAPISDTDGDIRHEGNEYVVDMSDTFSSTDGVDFTYSVTFPGEVTESAGGTVEGNTVTFTDYNQQVVRGRDSAGLPWMWIIIGIILAAALVGIIVAVVLIGKKKSSQQARLQAQMTGAYPAPDQAGVTQPGQAPGQPTAPVQPGQPGQTTAPVQQPQFPQQQGQFPPGNQYPQQ